MLQFQIVFRAGGMSERMRSSTKKHHRWKRRPYSKPQLHQNLWRTAHNQDTHFDHLALITFFFLRIRNSLDEVLRSGVLLRALMAYRAGAVAWQHATTRPIATHHSTPRHSTPHSSTQQHTAARSATQRQLGFPMIPMIPLRSPL